MWCCLIVILVVVVAMVLVFVVAALVVVLVVVQFHRFCEENIIPSLVALDAFLLNDFTELLTNRPLNLGFSLKMRLSPFVDVEYKRLLVSRMIYSYLVAKGDVKGIALFFNIHRRLSQRNSLLRLGPILRFFCASEDEKYIHVKKELLFL